ncbi:unnamed protein product [Cylicocyclus nassatus]|uniref:Uncharacterized protein n=1 Tax=Cylicocyclus nassatus TaxID=53992 RepID=A0AA36H9M8_CYLNA|nr:unnamed protein product [Cylicocyclus nassatus]
MHLEENQVYLNLGNIPPRPVSSPCQSRPTQRLAAGSAQIVSNGCHCGVPPSLLRFLCAVLRSNNLGTVPGHC